MSGIATFVSSAIENAMSTYVTTTSAAVSAGVAPLAVIGVTIWGTTYGMAVMRGEVADPFMVFVKNVLKMAIIMAIALSAGIYQSQVVDGVNAFQGWFVATVSGPDAPPDGNIFKVVDQFDEKVGQLGLGIIAHGYDLLPWGGWMDLAAGLAVLIASAVMILVTIGFCLMAKVALAFMLGIGPAFIVALAFPPTAKFFDAWLGKVMNYAFIAIGLSVVMSMAISVTSQYVSHFEQNLDATNAIMDAYGLVIVEGALLILVWQMPNIASGLAGGAALTGGGLGGAIAGFVMGRSFNPASNKNDNNGDKDGGSVDNVSTSSSGGPNSSNSNASTGRIPAYRRSTLDKLQNSRTQG